MKNCRSRAKPVMLRDCGMEVNAASVAAKAIGFSSTDVRRRRDKKNNRGGKAIVRCSSSVELPFAEIPLTEKSSCFDRGVGDC